MFVVGEDRIDPSQAEFPCQLVGQCGGKFARGQRNSRDLLDPWQLRGRSRLRQEDAAMLDQSPALAALGAPCDFGLATEDVAPRSPMKAEKWRRCWRSFGHCRLMQVGRNSDCRQ
jgi:hypothetical protein